MYISQIHIKGFRSLMEVEADAIKYTTLIGKNDCGKSSFLRAIQTLFDPQTPLEEKDVCRFPEHDKGCFIEATLEECDDSFELASEGKFRLRRIIKNGRSHWEYLGQIPISNILEKMSNGILTKGDLDADTTLPKEVKEKINSLVQELCPKGKVPADIWIQIFGKLVSDDLVEFNEGWCSFDSSLLSSLVQVVMLQADAKGEDEVKDSGRSIFSQIGELLLHDATKKDVKIQNAVYALKSEIERASTKTDDGKWALEEYNQFESILKEEVERFDKSVNATSTLIPPRIPDVKFTISVDVSDEWIKGLDKMGHGLRRSVVFAMLNTHRRLKKSIADDNTEKTTAPLYLFLVEEPELYLHPQAEQRRMRELKELSKIPDAQVILCTHSALFVDLLEYKGILKFLRPDRKATIVKGWRGKEIEEIDKDTLKTAIAFDSSRSSMMFADRVILVEGQSEKVVLPFLAEKLEIDNYDVEVVDCGGASSIPIFQKVLENFGIEYVAWLDSDAKEDIRKVRKNMTSAFGKIVLTVGNWEKMSKISIVEDNKPYSSWKHFFVDKKEPNEKLTRRVKAAYAWEHYEKDIILKES